MEKRKNLDIIKNILKMQHTHFSPDSISYIDCVISNDTPNFIPAVFNQTLTAPLCNKASDFYLLIQSLNFDREFLPILRWQTNKYFISFDLGGTITTLEVPFIARGPLPANGIYYLTQLAEMINSALQTLHTTSGATAPTGNDPPVMRYNSLDKQFSLYIPKDYTADIYFNDALNRLFSFDVNYNLASEPVTAEIINYSTPWNDGGILGPGITEYNMIPSLENTNWRITDIKGIVITSNTFPVNKEIIAIASESSHVTTNVLQRFFEVVDISEGVQPVPFQYVSEFDSYLIDMVSPKPLTNIGFEAYVLYDDESLELLQIDPGRAASVKFKLIHKSLIQDRESISGDLGTSRGRVKPVGHRR